MAGPNLVSFQGPANTQNPNTSEIPVSAANPLPVTITEGNLSLGNVSLVSAANVAALFSAPNGTAIAYSATADAQVVASLSYGYSPITTSSEALNTAIDGLSTPGYFTLATAMVAECLPTGNVTAQQFGNVALDGTSHALMVMDQGDKYVNISTATTTIVKNSPGTVKNVVVNAKGTTSSTTIKDGSTTVAIIDSGNLSGAFNLNALCAGNISCVTSGSPAPNITVTFE